ncbi:hypothetical protein B0H11DRAFT_2271929 [Mycena galericulata]|nr:hypothetical protein B0H11DRAFT_2271929 [Mycena galericulata]
MVPTQSETTFMLPTYLPLPAASTPRLNLEHLACNSIPGIWSDPNFDLATLMDTSDFEVPSMFPLSDVDFSTFDHNAFFGLFSDFKPGPSLAPANDPLHDLMNLCNPSFLPSDFGNFHNFPDNSPLHTVRGALCRRTASSPATSARVNTFPCYRKFIRASSAKITTPSTGS